MGTILSEAQALFKNLNSELGEARCLILLGNLQVIQGNQDKALDTLDKAMNTARNCGDTFSEYDAAQLIQVIQGRAQAQMAQFQQQMMPTVGEELAMFPQGGAGAEEAAPVSSVAAEPKGLDPAFVRKQLLAFTKDVIATDEDLELDSPFMEAGMTVCRVCH